MPQAEEKTTVNTPRAEHDRMMAAAALPRTLMGGTSAMRDAGKEYLPQEPNENDAQYKNRLARTFLFNKYGMTIDELVGRLFKNGIKLNKVPPEIEDMFDDVDLTGRDLRRFARDLFESALQPGVDYLLVDYPAAPKSEDEQSRPVLSRADEKKLGLRPFWVHIPQENLIGWNTIVVNGVETLARVRIRECVEEADGDWGVTHVEQVKVLYPGSWAIHRKDSNGDWIVHDEGTTSIDFIPLIPIYTKRTGFMTGEPPMLKLAELNLCHWQSSSDQRNILHVARVPILFGAGFDGTNGTVVVSASTMVTNNNPDAKLTFVEHTGAAIEAGANDLKELESQMQQCANEPLVPKTGAATATAKAIDTAQAAAVLETMGEDLSDCLEQAIKFTLAWMSTPEKDCGSVEFECDMSSQFGQQADLDALDKARARKDISRITYNSELQRRGVLSEEFDSDKDLQQLEDEGPALGDLGAGDSAMDDNPAPPDAATNDQGNPIQNADGTWRIDPAKTKQLNKE